MFPLTKRHFILASASPRRLALLQQIGLEPEICVAQAKEANHIPAEGPHALVIHNAKEKAAAAKEKCGQQDALLLAADTVVVQEGVLFGKPASAEEALTMLHSLSGHSHQVFTGCCLLDLATGQEVTGFSVTTVRFGKLTEEEIQAYLATGEPMDKAGAYGIQGKGALLVQEIQGDYNTVVGLPLYLLKELIQQLKMQREE